VNPKPLSALIRWNGAGRDTLAGRLTRTLILWVGGVWLLCILVVTGHVSREINHHFDNELAEISHRLFDLAMRDLERSATEKPAGEPVMAPPMMFAEDTIVFRVVDGQGRTLMRTAQAQDSMFDVPLVPGFANTGTGVWRVYTVRHPARDLYLQLPDPLEERQTAINRTLSGLILSLVAVLPLLALVLWQIARNGLHALPWLAGEIAQRSGADLSPIVLPALPRELRSVGEDVNRLLARLAQSLDIERALAANAAHELRTPLAAARLRLETALDHGLREDDVRAGLDALQDLSRRTEKLLQFSRAESGASLTRTPVDLVRLAGTVAEEFWQDSRWRERLNLKLPPSGTPTALGDVDALAIALRNLVENAIRYGAGQPVEIEVLPPSTIAVRDFGPGIDPQELRNILQRHVRHGADRAGYGLGLSIVSTICAKHGARLELMSPPPDHPSGFEARLVFGVSEPGNGS